MESNQRAPLNKSKRQFRHRKGGRGRGYSRGGRGYSRGRSRPYHRKVKSDHELVKSLRNVLKNEAIRFSLQVNHEGKVALSDLRRIPIFSEFDLTEDKIMKIVSNDSEQVFSVKQHKERGLLIGIRDTSTITYTFQKHEKMPLERFDKSWAVCHGTYFQNLKYILSEGLSCMHREFIHLSRTDSITGEKNGLRNDYDCLIYVNIQRAINDGIVFYLTPDNVILTTGVEGFLTRDYFHKIVGFSKSGPIHRNVLWADTNPEILHLHEQEILIDDIPNRTFVDLINICRDGFRCERTPGDCPFFHPQPKICEYFMRNWNCFIKGCKHKHLEHCFREDAEKTDEQVQNLDDMRKQKREARQIYMENKRKMIELQNGENSYHGHHGKSSNSRDRGGRFQKPSNGSHSYPDKRRNYKQQHNNNNNNNNNSAPQSHQEKRDASFEHSKKPVKRTSTNESDQRSASTGAPHHPPRQNRNNYRPHSPHQQKTQSAKTQNNVIITQNVEAPVMVVGQIVNNHNGGVNPPMQANVGWDPSKQPQLPQAKSPVPQHPRMHPGLSINPQLPRTHQPMMNPGYVAYSPLSTINNQFVVLPSALPSYSSPVPNYSPSVPRYSSPVPIQQNFQYFPSYPNAAFAAPQLQPQGFPPQTMNPVFVEEHLASKNQYQSRVKPYVVPRNSTNV